MDYNIVLHKVAYLKIQVAFLINHHLIINANIGVLTGGAEDFYHPKNDF